MNFKEHLHQLLEEEDFSNFFYQLKQYSVVSKRNKDFNNKRIMQEGRFKAYEKEYETAQITRSDYVTEKARLKRALLSWIESEIPKDIEHIQNTNLYEVSPVPIANQHFYQINITNNHGYVNLIKVLIRYWNR